MSADLLTRHLAATDLELGTGTPQPPQYRVFLRDPSYGIVDELDAWLSLDFVRRGNGIGTFSLEIANDTRTPSAVILQKAYGIVVKRDGDTVFSGSVTRFSKTFRRISVSGECDNALLRYAALPDPFTYPPNPTPPAYAVITAQASAVFLNLVNNNIGPAARADRTVAALTLAADPLLGSVITGRAGGQPIISLLAEMAPTPLANGLAFSILQSDTVPNALEFRVWQPVDRSEDAKFGVELGTAQDYEDTQQAPAANAVYVLLGDGLTGSRTILEDADAFSIAEWGRRFETILDRRDVTDPGEGNQALAEALAQTTTSRQVSVTPIDVPSLQWGRDWDLLDLVTFAAGGETFVDLIREIKFSWDPERGPAIVTPLIGQTGATNDDNLDVMVGTIQNRLSNAERNWRVPDNSILRAMMTDDSVAAAQILDGNVTVPKMDAIDSPADREVLGYNASLARFVWLSASEVSGFGTFTSLNVTGSTVLGDNAAVDTLGVNSIASFNGATTFNTTATFKSSVLIEDAGLVVTAFFDVANARLIVGSATPLSGASDDTFTVSGGVAYFAGPSGPAIGIRYSPADTVGWGIGVAAAGTLKDLLFRDDSGIETFRIGNSASTYQGVVTGDFNVTDDAVIAGDLSSDRMVVHGTTFSGSEVLRVQGTSRFENDLTGTTGVFDWQNSGNSRIKANSTGLGLFGATPIARPAVTGVLAGSPTLAQLTGVVRSLLAALDGSHLGAVTDSTT